jgi:hypothetical protein
MKDLVRIIKKHDCYAIAYSRQEFPVGRIRQRTLILDSPSRYRQTNAYGIDFEVLISTEMDYDFITIRERGTDWKTSKKFWLEHGKVISITLGRNEMFLPDRLFGLDKAEIYDAFSKPEIQKLLKKDVFDIGIETASEGWSSFTKQFEAWYAAMQLAADYVQAVSSQMKLKL